MRRASLFTSVSCAFLMAPVAAPAQSRFPRVEQSASLVVEIRAHIPSHTPDSQWSHGSGIVVGYRADTLFLVTAKHVLCGLAPCESPLADSVLVFVKGAPARPLVASRNILLDPDLDLAVLAVGNVASTGLQPEALPMRRLGHPGRLGPSAVLVPVGCSTTVDCWVIPLEPGRWERNLGPALFFRLLGLEKGYSGGGVFTADGEIVGMTVVDAGRVANIRALAIDSVRARVIRNSGGSVPFMLRTPRVPIRGYDISVSAGYAAGWQSNPKSWTGATYSVVTGAQVEAWVRVLDHLSITGRARYLASQWSRSGTLALGPQIAGSLSRRPDRLPSVSYRASFQVSASQFLAMRWYGGYYDSGGQWRYLLHDNVSTTVFGPALSGAVDVTLVPHLGAELGYVIEYFPWIRDDFPARTSVFSLSAKLSL